MVTVKAPTTEIINRIVKLTFTKLATNVFTDGSISRLLKILLTNLLSRLITKRPTKKTINAFRIVKPNWEACSINETSAPSNFVLASTAANNTILYAI